MRDLCGEVRDICAGYLQEVGLKTGRNGIFVGNTDCEAAYAMREGLSCDLSEETDIWLERPLQTKNRICFTLSESFYRDAAYHIMKEAFSFTEEAAPCEGFPSGGIAYARERMRMLARKSGESFPPDARRALWRAICAYSPDIPIGIRRRYLDEAAALALSIGKDLPLRQRQKHRESCALAAACLEKLLNEQFLYT